MKPPHPPTTLTHALDHVGQRHKHAPALGRLLYVVTRRGVVREACVRRGVTRPRPEYAPTHSSARLTDEPREPIEAVADRNVNRLAKHAIAARRVADHLRVAAAHVEYNRVYCTRNNAPHLDVSNAVVHTDERHAPELAERTSSKCTGSERRAHARAARKANNTDVRGFHSGLDQR